MATKSHGRCKVCRVIIHSSHRFGMCAKHGRQHYQNLLAQRRETKARKRARQTTVLEEGPDMSIDNTPAEKLEQSTRGTKPRNLSGDQEIEVLDAYTKTDEPIKDLSQRFGIKDTYVYNVLNRAGVDWRRGNPETFDEWQARQAPVKPEPSVPPAVEKALENMIVERPQTVLKPKPEPVAPTPTVERRVRPLQPEELGPGEATYFEVTVSGRFTFQALDMEAALQYMRSKYVGLKVTAIREL